jgi:hypothetical protein
MLIVGVPGWPQPSTEWDWWPFVGIAVALVVARRSMRLAIRPLVVFVAVAFGPVFAFLVDAYGVIVAIASVVVAAAALSWGRNRRRGDGGIGRLTDKP